jgi:RHS repeat-associated protein
MGWVTQLQKTIGFTTFSIQYQYNAGGQVTQVTYPSSRVVNQNVDHIGLLNTIVSGATTYISIPEPPTGNNAAGQILTFNYGNGVAANFGYSSATRDQLTSLSYTKGSQTLFSLNYGYLNGQANCGTGTTAANNGLIQCIQDLVDNGRSVVYGYDALNRLTSAATVGSSGYSQWGLSETFDRYGNRLNQTVTAGSGPANSLSFATTPAPPANPPGGAYTNHPDSYAFDASGNMLGDGVNTLAYDADNCLTTAGTATYTCDAHGIRIKKSLSGSTTTAYVFSGGQDIAEYDYTSGGPSPGSPSREYVYLGGRLIATIQGATVIYHHRDHFSVRVNTDANGNKIGEQGHYPYGETWYATSTTTKFIFTSYDRDSESGNDYAMARYYVNRFGRFSCADPVLGNPSEPQSWNRYTYVRNNPTNMTDSTGLNWFVDFLKVFAQTMVGLLTGGQLGQASASSPGTPPFVPGVDGTSIMLDSIYHPQDPSPFIINNWSPDGHDQMILNALGPCGVGRDVISKIQEASREFDKRTQAPGLSFMHSMRNGEQINPDGTKGQSAEEALEYRNMFIAGTLGAAQHAWNGGQTNNALDLFGQAIHPVMDSTSPYHTTNDGDPYHGSPIPWCGDSGCKGNRPNVLGHIAGLGSSPNYGESAQYLSAHPIHQQLANDLIRSAFQIMTGMHLNCP